MNYGHEIQTAEPAGEAGLEGQAGTLTVLDHRSETPYFDLPTTEGLTLVLGRGREADLDLGDSRVSRRHAQLSMRRGRHFIEDLGSIAGTEVNCVPVQGSVELSHGDRVQAGSTTLVYSAPGETPYTVDEPSADDIETRIPDGSPPPAIVRPPVPVPAESYRRALMAVMGLIAMTLSWMLLGTFE